jgi:hypothetical protein
VNAAYIKSRFAITTTDWTAIVAPIDCNYFALKNADGSALILRTDMNDAGTEDTLAPGGQETVTSGPNLGFLSGGEARFPKGATALWVKAAAGVGPVIVTWVL